MATLAEIRAKLQAQENKSSGSRQQGGDNAIFAHWNIAEGSSATLRFLPDADEGNTFFWKERQMIRLSFPGVKGQDENKRSRAEENERKVEKVEKEEREKEEA